MRTRTKFCLIAFVISAACAAAPARPQARFVYKFDGAPAINALRVTGAAAEWARTTEDGAAIEGTAEQLPAVRTGAVHLVLQPGKMFTTVSFDAASGLASDWTGSELLVMHADNGSEFLIPITLTIADAGGLTYSADSLRLVRSRNRLEIPLSELRAATGKPLDLARIQSMRLEFRSAEKFPRDLWLYHFYVAGSATPAAQKPGHLLLDFGPCGSPVFPGSNTIDEKTAYAPWRGYGWSGATSGFESWYFNKPKPDQLLSDFVWADLGSGSATLRTDLPDGRYRARFYGGNYTSKAMALRSFALAVNGKQVAAKAADPDAYYTAAEYFSGMDNWYEPGEDVWAKYGENVYQHYDFAFTVTGGHANFTWMKTLAAFGLLIAPEKDFAAAARDVDSKRREYFQANVVLPKRRAGAPDAGASEKQRGFIVWSRDWQQRVGPYDSPGASERNPKALRITAAKGQRAHVAVTVTPLKQLAALQASVSTLNNASGATLPASAIQLRAVKYMWDGWPASLDLDCLFPADRVPSRGDVNVTYWVTAAIPEGTAPGVYRGTVSLKAEAGGSAEVPLEITVLPFLLISDHPVSYHLWRNSDYNMSYSLRYFLPGKIDYFRKLLRAEAASLKAHGMTSFIFTPPTVKSVEGDHVTLDFSRLEEEVRVAKEFGLYGPRHPAQMFLLLDLARPLMKDTRAGDFQEPEDVSPGLPERDRVEEFSDLFSRRYIDGARQIQDFFDKHGIPVLLYTVDEPRERNINQWNRSLADAIRYAKVLRAAIPKARLYIDPMRDSNAGVSYLPLLDHYDVVATHPWDGSAKIYEATRDGKPELWWFNAIKHDRYDYGFAVAASHSLGFGQWHFGWALLPFQPFHGENRSGMTLPGPDGPLDTPEYEILAAAIDDYRYVATLRNRIEQAKKAGKSGPALAAAEADLEQLLSNTQPYPTRGEYAGERSRPRTHIAGRSLDEWRSVLARHIAALSVR